MEKQLKIITASILVLFVLVLGLYIKEVMNRDEVAYIDTSRLLKESKQMISLKKEIEKEQLLYKSNIDTLSHEFQNELKEYEKNLSTMTAREKKVSQELLRTKQQQMMQYQQAMQQKLQEEEQKKTEELLLGINAKIREFGEKENYKIILATSNGNIAYGNKGIDITENIIKEVNQ